MNSLRDIRLTKHAVFKEAFLTAHEAETMRFVAQNTSIPIPKMIDHWPMSHGTEGIAMEYMQERPLKGIVMEYIQGRPLATVWPSLNDDQKSHLVEQLQGYISELPSQKICRVEFAL